MKNTIKILALFFILLITAVLSGKSNSFLFRPYNSNFYVYGKGNSHFILRQSRLTQMGMNKALRNMATGKRINSAADDPAGLAVAEKISSILKQLQQESMNDEDMRNMYRFVESAVAENIIILKRIRILIVRSANGILSKEDKEIIQTEIRQFLRQIDMNARFAQFNKKKVIPNLTVKGLGLDKVNVVRNLYGSFKIVDEVINRLLKRRIIQGVKTSVMTFRIKGKNFHFINLQSAESNIRDFDYGINSLIKNSVKLKTQYGIILRGK